MIDSQASGRTDDVVAAFQIEGRPVMGRICRLGEASIHQILGGRDYPEPVAQATGEAALIATLVGSAMKTPGRLMVQAQGDGPAPLLAAEFRFGGALRAFAKVKSDGPAWPRTHGRAPLQDVVGRGAFAMTIDPGDSARQYQGVAPLEGDTLASAAESYFRQSEQIPTRLILAVGRLTPTDGPEIWRGGGLLLQHIASDDARGDTSEDWNHALALMETLTSAELLDPDLEPYGLLYRLFHEDGVRVHPPTPVEPFCGCSRERLVATLEVFPPEERRAMLKDGVIEAVCDYCRTVYAISPDEIGL